MKPIRVLQLGGEDWSQTLRIPAGVQWYFNDLAQLKVKKMRFELLIIADQLEMTPVEWEQLHAKVDPYNVVFLPGAAGDELQQYFLARTQARLLKSDRQAFVSAIPQYYYVGQQGIGIGPDAFSVSPNYQGSQRWQDSAALALTVDSDDWQPLANLRTNLFVDPDRQLTVWPVFQHDANVEIRYRFVLVYGSERQTYEFSEAQLQKPQVIPTSITARNQFLSVIVFAKGNGQMTLGNLELRWARYGLGTFINGGQAWQDLESRDEVQFFFNPGDLRPPLCVYFAGYHSKKSFEGYFMMKKMKVPYLLITDSRLEGGAFYTGPFFNQAVPKIIDQHLQLLGFDHTQLVMSGISMGTYGAIKFGLRQKAHAVIAAKPLVHLGTIAQRSRLARPDEFGTSFDLARELIAAPNELDETSLRQLDQKIIDALIHEDASETSLNLAYMFDDDYDPNALAVLKKHLLGRARQINYYGLPGRHNDDSSGMIKWFLRQYARVLKEDFGR